jgi:subtilisin family serine protease
MAYANATINTTLPAFRNGSTIYPALGKVTIPYSAAPELVPATDASRIVAPHDFVNETSTPLDYDGHGTHVSGTIGQLTNDGIGTAGVAFNVQLMPVKVLASEWISCCRVLTSPAQGAPTTMCRGVSGMRRTTARRCST